MRQMNVYQYFVYMMTNAWRNVLYKDVLVASMNPKWEDLAARWYTNTPGT